MSFFSRILVTGEDICFKFGVQIDIGHKRVTGVKHPTFCKIQIGDRCHLGFGFLAI